MHECSRLLGVVGTLGGETGSRQPPQFVVVSGEQLVEGSSGFLIRIEWELRMRRLNIHR
jgi:hypothetical protein